MAQWTVYNKKAAFKEIGQKFGIDQVTARIIRNRDIIEEEDIRRFIKGGLEDLYDPYLLKDVETLTDILADKIAQGKSIRIIGDYDIDGVMSTYILKTCLDYCGGKVSTVIPDRIKDGYGLNMQLIEKAAKDEVDTIITCDNGIAAIDEIARAKELGMTVLVTDHHEIPYEDVEGTRKYLRSQADAIVNPHQKECKYPNKNLCGAAVAWKCMQVLYERMGKPLEKTYELLENVAFATVGDIMDLTDENRILVKEGLKRIRFTSNIGMKALISQCGLMPEQIESYHFGFVLGPCINASGRLDTARRALELFLADNADEASRIASELVTLNEERKDMTNEGVELAKQIYEEMGYEKDRVIVIYMPQVHESIAGIIAGRIRETYNKPTFILTDGEEGVKGSGRSIEEYSMYDEMCKCKELFTRFGGHPMAAGFSLPQENVDRFRSLLNANCTLTEADLQEKVRIDVPMPLSYVTMDLVREFELLAPFGKANPKPVFADKNVEISRMWIIGKNQNVLRLSLKSSDGLPVSAIYFRNIDEFLQYLSDKFGKEQVEAALAGRDNNIVISMVYAPSINSFRDSENLQFEIQYYK